MTPPDDAASAPDAFPGHDPGLWAPVASEVVASWPQGHFAENLAVDHTGAVYVSLHSHNRIDRFDLSQIHITAHTRRTPITYAVFYLKKKRKQQPQKTKHNISSAATEEKKKQEPGGGPHRRRLRQPALA